MWYDWLFGLYVREQWRILFFLPKRPVSPKRDLQYSPIFACASCHSSKELQLWARARLAQARRSRLSESDSASVSFFSPRLGEGSSPEREILSLERGSSAWARGWARERAGSVFAAASVCFLYCWVFWVCLNMKCMWWMYGIGSQNLTWWVGYGIDVKYGRFHGKWMLILGMVLAWYTILFSWLWEGWTVVD